MPWTKRREIRSVASLRSCFPSWKASPNCPVRSILKISANWGGRRLEAWDAIIKRYGGFVAKHTGQGVLAYFGYPAGHEDDAERTAHAALEIVEATRALSAVEQQSRAQISVRIGIATGIVVVGGPIGQGASREEQAVGFPLNLAARLQALSRTPY